MFRSLDHPQGAKQPHYLHVQGGAKRTHVFQIIVTLFYFQYKEIMLTPKQPVIDAVLITYIDYSITENYRVAQKEHVFFK